MKWHIETVDYIPGKTDLEELKQDTLVKPLDVKSKSLFSCRKKEEQVTYEEKIRLLLDYLTLTHQKIIEWYIYWTPGKEMWAKYFIYNYTIFNSVSYKVLWAKIIVVNELCPEYHKYQLYLKLNDNDKEVK